MQQRHKDRFRYFNELVATSERYFLPYINRFCPIRKGVKVLEIGCGEGGNLLPFAQKGCLVTGVDIAEPRIDEATRFFSEGRNYECQIRSLRFLADERYRKIRCCDLARCD